MANEVLIKSDTPVVWADTADYAGDGGARTHQIDLTSIASTAAREGAKADLGATRARRYSVCLRVEFDVAPASPGNPVSLWWGPSVSAVAGTANPGGLTGADAGYTGTAGDSLADSIKQCKLIGALSVTSDADTVIQQDTWYFSPEERYGSPVVWNEADQAFEGDAVEMSITFTPIVDEVQ